MQVFSHNPSNAGYHGDMATTGRPPKQERTPFGERIAQARERIGLNQRELAEKIEVSQRALSWWERQPTAIKPDQLVQLAKALGVTVDHLVGCESKPTRKNGPTGKALKLFEKVSKLPKRKQQRILGTVEDMLIAQEAKAS
jgi:transcriptional regulator with XRE-family HTH domain